MGRAAFTLTKRTNAVLSGGINPQGVTTNKLPRSTGRNALGWGRTVHKTEGFAMRITLLRQKQTRLFSFWQGFSVQLPGIIDEPFLLLHSVFCTIRFSTQSGLCLGNKARKYIVCTKMPFQKPADDKIEKADVDDKKEKTSNTSKAKDKEKDTQVLLEELKEQREEQKKLLDAQRELINELKQHQKEAHPKDEVCFHLR